ncbi:hypothetical protein GCM10011409_01870 [Lentibacillus populi]|uniref:Aminoglycoside phosphotransferase domain-containing protein n=1 Tax=Lentibacillus populi TaxID=1827502 RepID=A0A9W5TU67_9BACI|nr:MULTISPECIES: phosphotransferase [Bacillaceae]MBT2215161.1 phosphotransferase [Virgibacillus dakarensis]GGB28134.1 hypothetical protein GCM10011409_01870 [Lentibacillus populi]
MDRVKKVLASYRIHPVTVEQKTENLYRIWDGKHYFALKESRMTDETISGWENVYHQAYRQNLSAILPVYVTEQGSLYSKDDQSFYYMTPWLPIKNITEQKQQIERLYQTSGTIHAITKQSLPMEQEKVMNNFKRYRTNLAKNRSELLSTVERFEKNRYMSPVELLVCTQFRDLDFVLRVLQDQVDRFIDDIKQESDWQYSLCHGQLDFSHVIFAHQTYLLNWERAHHDNATSDLANLFTNVVTDYDDPMDDLIELFPVYLKENKLTETELSLLAIYLLDPTEYITRLGQYRKNPSEYPQVDQVVQLQRCHRKLSFAVKWTENVDIWLESDDEQES